MESSGVVRGRNKSAVLTVAIMFLLAQLVPLTVFNAFSAAWMVLLGFFVFACWVQFWGTRRERITVFVALVVMFGAMFLPLLGR